MSNRNEISTKANRTEEARRIARKRAYANLPESVRRDMAKEVNMIQFGYKSTVDAAFEDARNKACDALDLMRAEYGEAPQPRPKPAPPPPAAPVPPPDGGAPQAPDAGE